MLMPTPCLTGMPAVIKEQIVMLLDPMSRMSLRKCDRDYRYYCDHAKTFYHRIELVQFAGKIEVHLIFDDENGNKKHEVVVYRKYSRGCTVTRNNGEAKIVHNYLCKLRVAADLKEILKNPNVEVRWFCIRQDHLKTNSWKRWMDCRQIFNHCLNAFKDISHLLKVHWLSVTDIEDDESQVVKFLRFFQPGLLTDINLHQIRKKVHCESRTEDFEDLGDLEQWKQANWISAKFFVSGHRYPEQYVEWTICGENVAEELRKMNDADDTLGFGFWHFLKDKTGGIDADRLRNNEDEGFYRNKNISITKTRDKIAIDRKIKEYESS